ncbi:hypothetical protein Pssp01_48350 [Pseudomonas sp. NBRC 100443]|nr:hypothetical protein Pssp01_48350 [Pseudomonas sp. NBRC 100443]
MGIASLNAILRALCLPEGVGADSVRDPADRPVNQRRARAQSSPPRPLNRRLMASMEKPR